MLRSSRLMFPAQAYINNKRGRWPLRWSHTSFVRHGGTYKSVFNDNYVDGQASKIGFRNKADRALLEAFILKRYLGNWTLTRGDGVITGDVRPCANLRLLWSKQEFLSCLGSHQLLAGQEADYTSENVWQRPSTCGRNRWCRVELPKYGIPRLSSVSR